MAFESFIVKPSGLTLEGFERVFWQVWCNVTILIQYTIALLDNGPKTSSLPMTQPQISVKFISYFINPKGWEKCRSKCPVIKPEPPTVSGAQLEPKDPHNIWDKELWESEKISFKCQNDSLVIDNTKGNVEVKFQCLPDGTYNTPTEDHKWPRCTEPPIDPCKCKLIN